MGIEFLFVSFCLALLPGPDILFVLAQSVTRGFRTAIAVSLGLFSGLFVHTAAVALGVAALVAASPVLFKVIKSLGALYLVFLGISALRAVPTPSAKAPQENPQGPVSFSKFYRRGIIMNLLNPKVIIFFLSFLPGFVPAESQHIGWQLVELGLGFAMVSLVVFGLISLFGGWLNKRFRIARYSASRPFAWVTAVLFWGIAGWILLG
ncbi:LysE family translocator [Candidatus Avelusimicrobium sp.]|uniref:LysE family translocator n=1 Tax=Candidatus Avelusimicrobium sp. TaxID=3048833 RepID=UPI003D7D4CE1